MADLWSGLEELDTPVDLFPFDDATTRVPSFYECSPPYSPTLTASPLHSDDSSADGSSHSADGSLVSVAASSSPPSSSPPASSSPAASSLHAANYMQHQHQFYHQHEHQHEQQQQQAYPAVQFYAMPPEHQHQFVPLASATAPVPTPTPTPTPASVSHLPQPRPIPAPRKSAARSAPAVAAVVPTLPAVADSAALKRACATPVVSAPKRAMAVPSSHEAAMDAAMAAGEEFEIPDHLSGDERESLVKRQHRLNKNRESAHASRQRKKIYVEELENKVSVLVAESTLLTGQNASLLRENADLRKHVFELANVLARYQHDDPAAAEWAAQSSALSMQLQHDNQPLCNDPFASSASSSTSTSTSASASSTGTAAAPSSSLSFGSLDPEHFGRTAAATLSAAFAHLTALAASPLSAGKASPPLPTTGSGSGSGNGTAGAFHPGVAGRRKSAATTGAGRRTKAKAAAGIALVIVMFSFGLLFQQKNNGLIGVEYDPTAVPLSAGARILQEFSQQSTDGDLSSEPAAAPLAIAPAAAKPPVRRSYVDPLDELLSADSAAYVPTPKRSHASSSSSSSSSTASAGDDAASVRKSVRILNANASSSSSSSSSDRGTHASSDALVTLSDVLYRQHSGTAAAHESRSPGAEGSSANMLPGSSSAPTHRRHHVPRGPFLYCPHPEVISPAFDDDDDDGGGDFVDDLADDGANGTAASPPPPPRLSLLIPGDALNGTISFAGGETPVLLEVSCAILSIAPLYELADAPDHGGRVLTRSPLQLAG